jgi:hypothetical protein
MILILAPRRLSPPLRSMIVAKSNRSNLRQRLSHWLLVHLAGAESAFCLGLLCIFLGIYMFR